MPIHNTVEGDLIKIANTGRYNAIAHGCNCFGRMGSGIAPLINKAFPGTLDADLNFNIPVGDVERLGCMSINSTMNAMKAPIDILNLYTQYKYGNDKRHLDYGAVQSAFSKINERYAYVPHARVGIPMIGAGLAKGHWDAIEIIINLVTPNVDIELVVYNG